MMTTSNCINCKHWKAGELGGYCKERDQYTGPYYYCGLWEAKISKKKKKKATGIDAAEVMDTLRKRGIKSVGISTIQRVMRVSYREAALMLEALKEEGYIG